MDHTRRSHQEYRYIMLCGLSVLAPLRLVSLTDTQHSEFHSTDYVYDESVDSDDDTNSVDTDYSHQGSEKPSCFPSHKDVVYCLSVQNKKFYYNLNNSCSYGNGACHGNDFYDGTDFFQSYSGNEFVNPKYEIFRTEGAVHVDPFPDPTYAKNLRTEGVENVDPLSRTANGETLHAEDATNVDPLSRTANGETLHAEDATNVDTVSGTTNARILCVGDAVCVKPCSDYMNVKSQKAEDVQNESHRSEFPKSIVRLKVCNSSYPRKGKNTSANALDGNNPRSGQRESRTDEVLNPDGRLCGQDGNARAGAWNTNCRQNDSNGNTHAKFSSLCAPAQNSKMSYSEVVKRGRVIQQ